MDNGSLDARRLCICVDALRCAAACIVGIYDWYDMQCMHNTHSKICNIVLYLYFSLFLLPAGLLGVNRTDEVEKHATADHQLETNDLNWNWDVCVRCSACWFNPVSEWIESKQNAWTMDGKRTTAATTDVLFRPIMHIRIDVWLVSSLVTATSFVWEMHVVCNMHNCSVNNPIQRFCSIRFMHESDELTDSFGATNARLFDATGDALTTSGVNRVRKSEQLTHCAILGISKRNYCSIQIY